MKTPLEITGIMWHGFENSDGFGELIVEVEYQGKWIVLTHQSLAPQTAFSEIMEPAGILRQFILSQGISINSDPSGEEK